MLQGPFEVQQFNLLIKNRYAIPNPAALSQIPPSPPAPIYSTQNPLPNIDYVSKGANALISPSNAQLDQRQHSIFAQADDAVSFNLCCKIFHWPGHLTH